MKFRLGDPVRVTDPDSVYFDRVGRVATIDKQDTEGYPFGVVGLSKTYPRFKHWQGPHELILAEAPPVTSADVRWPLNLGDKVRVIADPMRAGQFAGRSGKVASNVLDGIVWVFLGPIYANFHTSDLEQTEKP